MIGQSFGNYRVTGLIGEGGMGVVYAAEHPAIGRRAAVKILRSGLTDNPDIMRRFFNEARAANAIRHPGIVEVFDSGTLPSGVSYIVMELLDGESLAARLRKAGKLPPAEARALAAQMASVLAAAHAAGIVHRDLKPDNLFLVADDRDPDAEIVKVLDFGIAKLGIDAAHDAKFRTRTGAVMGTPSYMSPEQCRGTKEVDHRTDIYALGVILYEMVCGRPPFVSEGFGEMVHLHISEPPPPPRTVNPTVPADLETIIMSCLVKNPDQRTQTMAELYERLTGRQVSGRRAAARVSAAALAPTMATEKPADKVEKVEKTTFTQAALAVDQTEVKPRSRRGLVVSAVLVVGVAVGGVQLWHRRTASVASDVPPAQPPIAAPAPPVAPTPAEKPVVTAAIGSQPAGARVVRERDGAVIGTTPFRERWPSGDGVQKLRLELDGYRPEAVIVPLDRGVDLTFTLRKLAEAEPHRSHSGKRHAPTPEPAKAATAKPAAKPATKSPSKAEPVPL
jgi:serine/threonine-protein kinase